MTKLYKLTDENGCTYNGTQWGPNVTHSGTGKGELCGPGWIHAYESPLLAVLLNPIHAAFDKPRLWEAEGTITKSDGKLKCGCKSLKVVREIPLPVFLTEQRIYFSILCASAVYTEEKFQKWATNWIDGTDRSAWAAEEAAARAAWAARAAEEAAARAAWAAARAAEEAAARAARAAEEAAAAKSNIDLVTLAQQAYEWKP